MSPFSRELSSSLLYPSTLNGPSSIAETTGGAGNTRHIHMCWFFDLLVVLAAHSLLLLRVYDQPGGMASALNRGGARAKVGHTNMVEIEMLVIPASVGEVRLPRDVRQRR